MSTGDRLKGTPMKERMWRRKKTQRATEEGTVGEITEQRVWTKSRGEEESAATISSSGERGRLVWRKNAFQPPYYIGFFVVALFIFKILLFLLIINHRWNLSDITQEGALSPTEHHRGCVHRQQAARTTALRT